MGTLENNLVTLIAWAGIGQMALVAGSLAIPRILNWRRDLAPLPMLTRRMFWIYTGYIWTINLCFGLLSALAPHWLTAEQPLVAAVNGFMAAYWGARLVLQFACIRGAQKPEGFRYQLAEAALVMLFTFCTFVYGLSMFQSL
jgi:hypothetical protein